MNKNCDNSSDDGSCNTNYCCESNGGVCCPNPTINKPVVWDGNNKCLEKVGNQNVLLNKGVNTKLAHLCISITHLTGTLCSDAVSHSRQHHCDSIVSSLSNTINVHDCATASWSASCEICFKLSMSKNPMYPRSCRQSWMFLAICSGTAPCWLWVFLCDKK